MELQILKWFLLANLALGSLLRIALIGYENKYTKGGAAISLVANVAVGAWIFHALS